MRKGCRVIGSLAGGVHMGLRVFRCVLGEAGGTEGKGCKEEDKKGVLE